MSSVIGREYHKLSLRFDALSLREQVMILLCTVILVGFVAYFLLLAAPLASNVKIDKQIVRNQQDLASLEQQTQDLNKALQQDPNLSIKQRITAIQQQIDTVDQQLALQTSNLVPANKMPKMLETVLTSSADLNLLSLQSIAPLAISLAADKHIKGAVPEPALYRHGVKLVFEGTYFDVQNYLATLESLEWQFYWKKFDYKVSEYPLATVELEIYTLSTNKAFIGV